MAHGPLVFYYTDLFEAVVPVLVLLFVALWFILRGDLFYVLPCAILFLYVSVLLALRLSRLWKRELIFVLFVRLFDLRLFGLVLSVSSSSWCLGRAAVCDYGTPWTFLLPFFYSADRSKAVDPVLKKGKEKSPESATITNPSPSQISRGRGNRQIQTSTNRTNARKALRLALSSPSEVIAILRD